VLSEDLALKEHLDSLESFGLSGTSTPRMFAHLHAAHVQCALVTCATAQLADAPTTFRSIHTLSQRGNSDKCPRQTISISTFARTLYRHFNAQMFHAC
jgi:hypothetical protein